MIAYIGIVAIVIVIVIIVITMILIQIVILIMIIIMIELWLNYDSDKNYGEVSISSCKNIPEYAMQMGTRHVIQLYSCIMEDSNASWNT